MAGHTLVLDPQIRDWVVLPMVAIMVLMGLARHYIQQLMKSDSMLDKEEIRFKQTLMRVNKLRQNGGYLSEKAFKMRKAFFNHADTGVLHEKVPKAGMNMMTNPMGMVDMMKGNITMIVPNMVMMTIISYFFSGFVLVKIPFPLTNRFKMMLQRGVDLSTLDVTYVSSLSWYFLLLFGLRGVFKLILGEDSPALNEAKAAQAQMGLGLGAGAAGMGFNAEAAYKQERDALEVTKHTWYLQDIERELLGPSYPAGAALDDEAAAAAVSEVCSVVSLGE